MPLTLDSQLRTPNSKTMPSIPGSPMRMYLHAAILATVLLTPHLHAQKTYLDPTRGIAVTPQTRPQQILLGAAGSPHRSALLPDQLQHRDKAPIRNCLHRWPALRSSLDQRKPRRHLQLRHFRPHRLPRLPRRCRRAPALRPQHPGHRSRPRPRYRRRSRPHRHPADHLRRSPRRQNRPRSVRLRIPRAGNLDAQLEVLRHI